eukprot:1930033-Amphidinium_carterae.1
MRVAESLTWETARLADISYQSPPHPQRLPQKGIEKTLKPQQKQKGRGMLLLARSTASATQSSNLSNAGLTKLGIRSQMYLQYFVLFLVSELERSLALCCGTFSEKLE